MKKINVNLFPKSGYVFKDKDGTMHVSTRGWTDLIARVTAYRSRNKMDIGNVKQEVTEQGCERNPGYCFDDNAAPVVNSSKSTIKSAVLSWLTLTRRIRDELRFVSTDEATKRAETCANCPFNVPVKQGCAPCQTFIAEMRKSILKDRKVDSRLKACEKLLCDTGVLVHLDRVTEKRDDLPDHCWKKAK